MKLKTRTDSPPEVTPTMKTLLRAVHLIVPWSNPLFFSWDGWCSRCHDTEAKANHTQQAEEPLELWTSMLFTSQQTTPS